MLISRISKRLWHPRTLDEVTICRHATTLTQLTALMSPSRGFTSHECTARRAAGLLLGLPAVPHSASRRAQASTDPRVRSRQGAATPGCGAVA
jgi:hypothetical protein